MNMPAIRGWCPGALRPMESGDGLIVRLKLTGGIVPLGLATQIAAWSHRFGNGEIDLTARANLQLRGITDESLPGLRQAIADAGLLDENPDGEAIRNVIASPLAGLDPDAVFDIRPMVAELEARLTGDPKLYGLPAKFCFAVDDGGRLGLGTVRADIRFEALLIEGEERFAIYFDGGEDRRIGSFKPEHTAWVAASLISGFFAYQRQLEVSVKRMRDVVAAIGIRTLAGGGSRGSTKSRAYKSRSGEPGIPDFLGVQPLQQRLPVSGPSEPKPEAFLGVGLPFGRTSGSDLNELANKASRHGAQEIRLTPWRAILVPLPSQDAAHRLANDLSRKSYTLDAADPRRRVAACVGAPACQNATTTIRDDAARLAPFIATDSFLHVSGCAKGCAHPRAVPLTLVGRDGLYDLVRDGAASDSPALRGLTLDETAAYLRQMAATQTQGPAT